MITIEANTQAISELDTLAQMLHADLLVQHPGTQRIDLGCVMKQTEDMIGVLGCKYRPCEVIKQGETSGFWTRRVKELEINPSYR